MSGLNRLSASGLLALAACVLVGFMSRTLHAADAPAANLVIVKAVYGELPDGATFDVTEKLAGLVKDDVLAVVVSSDAFGDPADGKIKTLKVDYTIRGVAHSRTASEGDYLVISGKLGKLIIRKAIYGNLPDGAKVDVTAEVQERVANDSLSVEVSNANFGDPAFGSQKKLTVDYTFDGKENSKTVNEGETLTISNKGE